MHPTALNFGKSFFDLYCQDLVDATVVDIGSQNINGSLKDVCPPDLKYIGVDFVAGHGVDIILDDPYKLPFDDESVDVVVCSSCFEHSDFFWLLFLEILRVLKPEGLFYLNVPSNGYFHKYPVDSWRFYPDSGKSLVSWAERNGFAPVLLESFIGAQAEGIEGKWNDFVAVFGKTAATAGHCEVFMVDVVAGFNGYRYGSDETILEKFKSEDLEILEDREARIIALNQEFSGLCQAVAERDEQIARLIHVVSERDRQIDDLNHVVSERDRQIDDLNHVVSERDRQIDDLKIMVKESKERVVELTNSLTVLHKLIAGMQSSKSWRITSPLRNAGKLFRNIVKTQRMLPHIVQKGGGLPSTARKAMRIFCQEGFDGVKMRLRKIPPSPQIVIQPVITVLCERKLSIIPYYIDPRLDESNQSPEDITQIAIHLHLFYPEMLTEFVTRLRTIPCAFDLYVSVPETCDALVILTELKTKLPAATKVVVESVPNRGRDIAPLIVQFGERLSRYEIIAHFHTKKSEHNSNLAVWCTDILDQLLGTSASRGGRITHIINLLQGNAKVVYPEGRTEVIKDRSGWADNHTLARQLLKQYTDLSIDDFPFIDFPEGSMFWARTECLMEFLALPLRYDDFPSEPIPADGTLAHALERLILVFASKHEGQCFRVHKGDSIHDYRCYEEQRDYSPSVVHHDIKVLSYYLPQFHPIPENDLWHGKGFTEWTKVRAANPLFVGHYQQHIPHPDIGYYLLDSPDTLRTQAEQMRQAGVYGQVFYHYWFSGKLILEEPARMLLDTPDIDMPFCFCWANENWTRRWDGNENEILLGQNYSAEDASAFIQYLIPFFSDRRYVRVDNRPVLFVYRPSSIPNVHEYLHVWEKECAASGINRPYVVAVLTRGATSPHDFGMDAGVERVLHDWTAGAVPEIKASLSVYQTINGSVLSYDEVADFYGKQIERKNFTYFRSLVPIWDNTARYGSEAYLLHGSTPQKFQQWLEKNIEYSQRTLPDDRRFVLINAWNEWAEGAHLEPDSRYGYSYLNSVGRALSGIASAAELNPDGPLPLGLRVRFSFPEVFLTQLQSDPFLRQRFLHCLAQSTVFTQCSVSLDVPEFVSELSGQVPLVEDGESSPDFILQFRRVAFFEPSVIEKMLRTACNSPGSLVVSNAYDRHIPLLEMTDNGSVPSFVAHSTPLLLLPANPARHGYKNCRVRSDAHSFVGYPNADQPTELPFVTTIIRFHKAADIGILKNALYCLAAMQNCVVVPLIAAQDLSNEQVVALDNLIKGLATGGFEPQVHHYHSANGNGDLRSRMLHESLLKVKTRYAAFLDYDDLLMAHAYSWLITRLKQTGKAVSFGRVYSAFYNGVTGQIMERKRIYEYGYSYDDFLCQNHAPLHSFMLDLTQFDLSKIVFHENHRYMEDYFLTLQLFTRDNADWDGLRENVYIGDYIHSVNRAHTLAFSDDQERRTILSDPEYMICEQRICDMRNAINSRMN